MCFEEIMFTRQSIEDETEVVTFQRTRSKDEADSVRAIAYRKCKLISEGAHTTTVDEVAATNRLLFFERRQNRRIVNAAALTSDIDGDDWDARLFVEPVDLDFCAQVN